LKKNSSSQEESSLVACCRSREVEKKKFKKKSSVTTALRPNLQLTSKKKLVETIDMICDAVPISRDAIYADERFFGFDKASDYQKGPSGFQINQTEDQKRYYAALANLKKKKNLF
jgi:hypothetical protein